MYAQPSDLDTHVQGATVPAETATQLLELAADAINQYVQRPAGLNEGVRVETLGGSDTDTLYLEWPISAVESVVEDGATLDSDQYRWSRSGWLTRRGGSRRWRRDHQLEVTYTAGFPDGSSELGVAKRISLEIAARVAANPQALRSLNTDGTSVGFGGAGSLTEDEQRDLKPLSVGRRTR